MKDFLDNLPVVFGLKAQGLLPTVEAMVGAGESWESIGKAIGWCPDAVRRRYLAIKEGEGEKR